IHRAPPPGVTGHPCPGTPLDVSPLSGTPARSSLPDRAGVPGHAPASLACALLYHGVGGAPPPPAAPRPPGPRPHGRGGVPPQGGGARKPAAGRAGNTPRSTGHPASTPATTTRRPRRGAADDPGAHPHEPRGDRDARRSGATKARETRTRRTTDRRRRTDAG